MHEEPASGFEHFLTDANQLHIVCIFSASQTWPFPRAIQASLICEFPVFSLIRPHFPRTKGGMSLCCPPES